MEKKPRWSWSTAICSVVVLLSTTAFSCALSAEFKKVKAKDMKLDGSLCSLPKSCAFELGIAAIICLSVAQLVGTSAAATSLLCSSTKTASIRSRIAPFSLLVLSWVSFALAIVILATASSMNHGQDYGRGWMDGDCYVAKDGVFGGSAALVIVTALFILGFIFATRSMMIASTAKSLTRHPSSLDAAQSGCQPK